MKCHAMKDMHIRYRGQKITSEYLYGSLAGEPSVRHKGTSFILDGLPVAGWIRYLSEEQEFFIKSYSS